MTHPPAATDPPGAADPRAVVAVLCATLALLLAAIYWLARQDLPDNPGQPVVLALALSWFVLLLPATVRKFLPALRFASDAPLALGAVAVLALAGLGAGHFGGWAPWPLAVLGGAFACVHAATLVRLHAAAWLGVLGFSVWIAGYAWGWGYQSPLFQEGLAAGTTHVDTLYHATIANMIRTYGVASTGLDGLPPLRYHLGSHWLFAQLSRLLDVEVWRFYQVGFQVIFVPFVVQCFLGFVLDLRDFFARGPAGWDLGKDAWAWLLFATAFAGLPGSFSRDTGWLGPNLVCSESYGLATALACLIGSLGLPVVRRLRDATPLNAGDKAFLLAGLPVLLGLLGWCKISWMAVLLGTLGLGFLRLGLYRSPLPCASLLLQLAVGAWTVTQTSNQDSSHGLQLFDFVRVWVLTNGREPVWPWLLLGFLTLHFVWLWAYLALRLREAGVRSLADLRSAWRQETLLDAELVLALAVLAVLPGSLLAISSGGAYYFSDVQRWVAAAFLLARLDRFRPLFATAGLPRSLPMGLRRAVPQVAATALALAFAANAVESGQQGLATHAATLRARAVLPAAASDPTLQHLHAIDRLPLAVKAASLLYIPRDHLAYWALLPATTVPFLAPALSGVALVDGAPRTDEGARGYGFNGYPPRAQALDLEQARARAHALGFATLLTLDAGGVRQLATDPRRPGAAVALFPQPASAHP